MKDITEGLIINYLLIKITETVLISTLAHIHQLEYEQNYENYCKSISEINKLKDKVKSLRQRITDIDAMTYELRYV